MSTRGNTFVWPGRQRSSWALVGCILLSLTLHSAPFFLFQAAPPRLTPPPRAAHPVQLLTPYAPDGTRSEENEEVLRWVAANDPAIVARIPTVEPKGLLDIPFEPSFATPRTAPLDVPPEPATVKFPPARDSLALIRSGAPREAEPVKAIAPQPTKLSFSPSLAKRVPGEIVFSPKAKSDSPVEPLRVMIGVTPAGEARFAFVQRWDQSTLTQPSGEQPLEHEALDFLSTVRFAPGDSLTWGTVTINWGNEIAR